MSSEHETLWFIYLRKLRTSIHRLCPSLSGDQSRQISNALWSVPSLMFDYRIVSNMRNGVS